MTPTPLRTAQILHGCADDIEHYSDKPGILLLVADRLRRLAGEFDPHATKPRP